MMKYVTVLESGWLRVDTPDPDIWCEQSNLINREDIDRVKLVKKLTPHGPDNGVEIVTLRTTDVLGYRVWVRCGSFEQASQLYDELAVILPNEE